MVSFEVFNATLWNIVLAINKIEKGSCSIQLMVRNSNGPNETNHERHNETSIFESSIDMSIKLAIPIVFVDFSENVFDQHYTHSVKLISSNIFVLHPYV